MIWTKRLRLRPLRADDLTALHAIFSNPCAMRYWDRPAWDDVGQTRALLEAFMRDAPDEHLEYAVEKDGTCIGRVGMWKRWEIGYILAPDHWGHGYATEAVAALIADVWRRFPAAERLTAEIDPRNIASARLLEKQGFVLSHIEERNFRYGDEWCDTAYYALPRPATDPATP